MKIFIIVFLLYVVGGLYLYFIQERKVFQRHFAKIYTPITAKEIEFITSDKIKLKGAYLENKKNAPLVLYFSGNANNAIEFVDKIAPKLKNYNFLAFNYPGFANSEGKPSEKSILKYALEIYDKYKPDIVMGRSLGSAVASFITSKRDVKGIVLITPFDSIENIAKSKYPIYPISLLLKHKFKEYEFISKTKAPVVVVALENDDLIPKNSLENLLIHIPNLKDVIYFSGVKHGFIYEHEKIVEILNKALGEVIPIEN